MPVWLVQHDRIPVGTKIVRGNMTYWVAETRLEVPPPPVRSSVTQINASSTDTMVTRCCLYWNQRSPSGTCGSQEHSSRCP